MVERHRFVAQTQVDGKVNRVFDSSEMVSAADYAALEARNAEQFRLMGQYMENAEAAHERIAELEAALREVNFYSPVGTQDRIARLLASTSGGKDG